MDDKDKNVGFKPAWWLRNPHLQTLWPTVFRKKIKGLSLRRERIELPDGDFIDLDWAEGASAGPIVIILHGLEGSVHSPYAKGMLKAIRAHGWRGAFVHFRGCSGEANRLQRGYHSGETQDVAWVVHLLKEREQVPIAAIGFSLGGNVLIKWLGETGVDNPLVAAVGISVPFELKKVCLRINQGFSRVYQQHLLNCLRKKLKNKFKDQAPPFSLQSLSTIKTLYEFDEKITAPIHGFSSAEDYYRRSSSRPFVPKIQTPTLLLQSKDDPFLVEDLLPRPNEIPKMVEFELTSRGGACWFCCWKMAVGGGILVRATCAGVFEAVFIIVRWFFECGHATT